jgi:hypothetical protein
MKRAPQWMFWLSKLNKRLTSRIAHKWMAEQIPQEGLVFDLPDGQYMAVSTGRPEPECNLSLTPPRAGDQPKPQNNNHT